MTSSTSAELASEQLLDDLPVGEEQDPVGDRRGARVVGHHHDRLAVGLRGVAQQVEDVASCLRVEVPGRLVGEQDRRAR